MEKVKRKDIVDIVITYIFVLVAVFCVNWVNAMSQSVSLAVRLILIIVAWWPMLLATIYFMLRDKKMLTI